MRGTQKPERSHSARIASLEAENAALTERAKSAETALANLRLAYTKALEELQLMKRRLFVAKAERSDGLTDQLAFDTMFEKVAQLAKQLDAAIDDDDSGGGRNDRKKDRKPSGRRDLSESDLPVVHVEIVDPELEGKAERIGVEESSRLGYERGGMRHIVVRTIVYKAPPEAPATGEPNAEAQSSLPSQLEPSIAVRIVTAKAPKELFRRALLAPSMIAHVLTAKYLLGVPFYRLEQSFALQGASLDRGTMCRYAEDAGATLGAIVLAMRDEAFATSFCLSTDATGVSIQPGPLPERSPRRPCRKAHFFVVLADRDHIFFEYEEKHTSAAVCSMFKGFSRYIQADAHTIYDALFSGRPPPGEPADPDRGRPPIEVGCWSHCRRHFWEAAVCKHPLGVEGMKRIDAIFAADALLDDMAPAQRKQLRQEHVRPHVDAFFDWVEAQRALPRERGLVASALGYAHNQQEPLRRFLEDGRLRLDNNRSERALRAIASARKTWLFFGSDDHANAAANLFSLVASCKLHSIDPEQYLAEAIHVMPYWPRERYLELSPKYWRATRARLDPAELAREIGDIAVPASMRAEEQTASG
jgi:transposase